jgi:uncharacterized protein
MSLLVCPNDGTSMQAINRNGVLIDVCPQCRGVWLDRGELEMLLEKVRIAEADEESYGYEHDERRYRGEKPFRKKRPSIFDFFD